MSNDSDMTTEAAPRSNKRDGKSKLRALFGGVGQMTEAKQKQIEAREAAEVIQIKPRTGRKGAAPRDADVRMRFTESLKERGQASAARMGVSFTDLMIDLLTKHLNSRGE